MVQGLSKEQDGINDQKKNIGVLFLFQQLNFPQMTSNFTTEKLQAPIIDWLEIHWN